ncbi:hypothetical protein [Archangium sp. Cb G35]|uniref:hypothetical protein n=1 Tax=Archangium sp. Cb G35 TaxID=1920190 RepID=UPI001160E68C|nr:hypothetical protein [Archangium sp. Cb G35]
MPIRNVLLMLSSHAPPPPREEVAWHVRTSKQAKYTYLVTTKELTGLVPGESSVAFYGDADLNNTYLGRGLFHRYLPLNSSPGLEILSNHALYSQRGYPTTAKGLIALSNIIAAERDELLESLNGTIVPTKLPLRLRNIPKGQARARIYFLTEKPLPY